MQEYSVQRYVLPVCFTSTAEQLTALKLNEGTVVLILVLVPLKRVFAGGPQIKKMTMPDNTSSQSVSIDKVQNRG